jgi:hypothetical protein
MKTRIVIFTLLFTAFLAISCRGLAVDNLGDDTIKPSDVVITEERTVGAFTGIDMSTFGRILLMQGESESLSISGSDNIVPYIKTNIHGGVLSIETDKNINIIGMNSENILTFNITVRDLTSLTISGAGKVEMPVLSTSDLEITMSGAGEYQLGQLNAEGVQIDLTGLGNITIAGEVSRATIEISGAGEVSAGDLKCQTADITIPGLGNATVWVTERLTGNISGGGNVSYYGNPQTNIQTSGIGQFRALGSK